MSSADRVAHIDGQLRNYCEQYTRASSGVYKCPGVNKTGVIHLRMFAGVSVLTTFSAPQILAAIDSFLLPNSRNEEMTGDGFVLPLPVCFEQ